MDEIDKVRLKSAALLKARDYLLNQAPSDPVVIAQVTENIVDLAGRHLVEVDPTKIPKVSSDEERKLKEIIENLQESIEKEVPAIDILEHTKHIFDLAPWPPKGVKLNLPDLNSWPTHSGDIARWPPKKT
jgi:hypothetical protein